MTSLKTNLIQTAKIITLGLVVGLGVNFLFAYTGPGSTPPACVTDPASPDYRLGCVAPINVGTIAQLKSGPLSLVSLFVTNLTIPTNAGANKVLTSDAVGVATWQTPTGGGGVSKIIAGNGITVTSTGTGGTGDVTINSSGGYTNMQVFNASGSWTAPAGVTKVKVRAWGAGGQGYFATGGGGGGGYGEGIYTVVPGTTYTVTIGASAGPQTAGTITSLGSLITSRGGTGAAWQGNTCQGGGGGTSDGLFNIPGENGTCTGGRSPMGGGEGVTPGGGGAKANGMGGGGRVVVEY